MVDWGQLALWALITGGTPLILLLVPASKARLSDRATHLMLGFSAGILGGLASLNILPEAFRTAGELPAGVRLPDQAVPLALGLGFLVLLLIERHLLGRAGRAHLDDGHPIRPFGTLAVSALAVHGTMDGFVIPLGFQLGTTVGTVIVLAVAVHQIPDSFAALSVGLTSGHSRRTVAAYVLATALDTPLGIVLGVAFLGAGQAWLPLGLAFSAGTFLFVSAADLVPELQHRSRSLLVTLSIVAGFLLILGLTFVPGG
ncbi:MAG: hypothetical protein A3K65_05995 [Euryarchaeota archaeon RBG_16_68_12]|nr:MAG: hypothetical protein A3K65_05995 [Euryarchaeota archaeon RBG_16_68_12]